jgi:diguanylate cyclase (GGDEF)-like protein
MLAVDLTHAQFLWLMVSLQFGIMASIWMFAALSTQAFGPALRMFGIFNLCLGVSLVLVVLRGGMMPDLLTRTFANLTGLSAFVALWAGALHLYMPKQSMTEAWTVAGIASVLIVVFGLMPGHGNYRIAAQFIAMAWLMVRASVLCAPLMRQRFGALPVTATMLIAWGFAGVLVIRSMGAILFGWSIEIERDHSDSLAFAYLVMLSGTSINSILAFIMLRSLLADLESLVQHDSLTGMLNRRAFNQRQAAYWERWKRQQNLFALICIDIDHFKHINDEYGHAVGDQVLIQVAKSLQAQIRPMDTLARTGGEEFVVLLDLRDAPDDLQQVAERLRSAVAELVPWPAEPDRRVTVSLGVSVLNPRDERPENVMTRADHALYRAKALGRNRVELSEELVKGRAAPGLARVPVC